MTEGLSEQLSPNRRWSVGYKGEKCGPGEFFCATNKRD